MSTYAIPRNSLPGIWTFRNQNNQYLNLGPLVDGLTVGNTPPTYVTDLILTASLYANRVLYNAQQPGTLVPTFGTSGNLTLPHVGGGVYRGVVLSALQATIGDRYVLVFDAPQSVSGYQLHREFQAQVVVGNWN